MEKFLFERVEGQKKLVDEKKIIGIAPDSEFYFEKWASREQIRLKYMKKIIC